jgi:molybdopterin converting factor small subunit
MRMSITIKIKYFVPLSQLMGKVEELQLGKTLPLEDLIQQVSQKYKGFAESDWFPHMIVLQNGEMCQKGRFLQDGDEIAILVPQVGG